VLIVLFLLSVGSLAGVRAAILSGLPVAEKMPSARVFEINELRYRVMISITKGSYRIDDVVI